MQWAKQGVLLLNVCLTVRAHQANSHAKQGWEQFTDAAIGAVNRKKKNVVFLLWGKSAELKAKGVDRGRHHVLTAAHPSGLSASRVSTRSYCMSCCFVYVCDNSLHGLLCCLFGRCYMATLEDSQLKEAYSVFVRCKMLACLPDSSCRAFVRKMIVVTMTRQSIIVAFCKFRCLWNAGFLWMQAFL